MDVCRNCQKVISDADFSTNDTDGVIANRMCPYCRKDPRFSWIGRIVRFGSAAIFVVAVVVFVVGSVMRNAAP